MNRVRYQEYIGSYELSENVRGQIERIDSLPYDELGDLLQVLSYKIEIKAIDEVEQGRPKIATVLQSLA